MSESRLTLQPGTLWPAIVNGTRKAIEKGALRPIETDRKTVTDHGIAFDVRVVSSLALKAHEASPEVQAPGFNPFLPYDEDLYVTDISDTHVGILNKFPVVDNHLLIITRVFKEQTSLLTLADFEALWTCMQEFDGLAFYNAGRVAGASQRHKHLQLVPLFTEGSAVPIEPAIAAVESTGGVGRSPMLPFKHAITSLSDLDRSSISAAASGLLDLYGSMLRSVNIMDLPDNQRIYNLLATRRWMMLAPRLREHFQGISMNALGFAGEMLVMDRAQLETLRRSGPMAALQAVGV